jgi:hypothetical protein
MRFIPCNSQILRKVFWLSGIDKRYCLWERKS